MKKRYFLLFVSIPLLMSAWVHSLASVNSGILAGALSFTHSAFVTVGDHPAAVISGDFDGDGDLDVVAANDGDTSGTTVSLLANDGAARFELRSTIETGTEPIALTAADWNQDGHLDLAVANHISDEVSILINDGASNLVIDSHVAFPERSYPFMMAVGDFDQDQDEDLAVATYQETGAVVILGNNGAGEFAVIDTITIGGNPYTIISGDYDRDGDLDLAAAKHDGGEVVVLFNEGGDFSVASTVDVGINPWSLAGGDLDADGAPDLVAANAGSNDVTILLNDGSGGFTPSQTVSVGDEPYSVASGDLDQDGDLDLAVANEESHDVLILSNDGAGAFSVSHTVEVGEEPWSVILSDLDGDQDLDIVTANADSDNVSIVVNNLIDGVGE